MTRVGDLMPPVEFPPNRRTLALYKRIAQCPSEDVPVSIASPQTDAKKAAKPRVNAREAMESLNAEAGKFNIWLRTEANAPAQRPWFRDTDIEQSGKLAVGRVGANQ